MHLDAIITCPDCHKETKVVMPERHTDSEYVCPFCAHRMTATEEQCCVYCAYSNMICPEKQLGRDCCSG